MELEDLRIYQAAMEFGERIWEVSSELDWLAKSTMGVQVIRSADSVAANIAEGFGRFHFKENQKFCYYSRGSLYETKTWVKKLENRSLIDPSTSMELIKNVNDMVPQLNAYIRSIGKGHK